MVAAACLGSAFAGSALTLLVARLMQKRRSGPARLPIATKTRAPLVVLARGGGGEASGGSDGLGRAGAVDWAQ
jgi:hypothetical protein